MSDYHILQGTDDGNSFSVAMHFPVPNVPNAVGTNYRTALVESRDLSTFESAVPWIDPLELTDLRAGIKLEHLYRFRSNPTETLAQKRDKLDVAYADELAIIQPQLSLSLEFWGYDRDVP